MDSEHMMTFEEYKALEEEHRNTDSLKRREEIESEVLEGAVTLLRDLDKLYAKYGRSFVDNPDFRPDGEFTLDKSEEDEFDDLYVYLSCHVGWTYGGGEYLVKVPVPVGLLKEKNRALLEAELKEKRIESLRQKLNDYLAQIDSVKAAIAKVEEELKALER